MAWAPDGKPQRSWRVSGPFHGLYAVTHWLWALGLPPWRRVPGLLRMEELVAGFSHSLGGPLPGCRFLSKALPREETHRGDGHLRKVGHGLAGCWAPAVPAGCSSREGALNPYLTPSPTRLSRVVSPGSILQGNLISEHFRLHTLIRKKGNMQP